MNWQLSLELVGLASAACCALICFNGWRKNRRPALLPPPSPNAFRDAYSHRRYTVGHMGGVGK